MTLHSIALDELSFTYFFHSLFEPLQAFFFLYFHSNLSCWVSQFNEALCGKKIYIFLVWTHFPLMLFDILCFLGNEQEFLIHLFPWYQDFIEPHCIIIHFSFLNWRILIEVVAVGWYYSTSLTVSVHVFVSIFPDYILFARRLTSQASTNIEKYSCIALFKFK